MFKNNLNFKRLFDCSLSLLIIFLAFVPMTVISLGIKLTTPGPIIHWSKRVGKDNKIFIMPKFRTMTVDTPQVATHLLDLNRPTITKVGKFLRKYSLDELPQLFSILKGDMSLVGPRPALFNQEDLVNLRTKRGIHKIAPGITGWAQINGRDEISIKEKVIFDKEYLDKKSIVFDIKIIWFSALKVLSGDGVSH